MDKSRPLNASLKGTRVLITRPASQAKQLADLLQLHGAEFHLTPLLTITPPKSWKEFDAAIKNLPDYAWLIFASANAVDSTLCRVKYLGDGVFDLMKKVKIACVGKSTAATLEQYGLQADLVPEKFVAESLVEEFARNCVTQESGNHKHERQKDGKRVLWPKTNKGRLLIKDDLEKLGWKVDIVHSYSTEGPEDPEKCARELHLLIESNKLDIITLTSSEAVVNLDAILEMALQLKLSKSKNLPKIKLAVIGPETARTCMALFGRVDIQATEYSIPGLVNAISNSLD